MRLSPSALAWALTPLYIYVQPSAAKALATRDDAATSTTFNGKPVPPMTELNGESYKTDISVGYWFVEGYSPYCGHCKHLAPKLQTLYEFYFTSDPLPASNEPPNAKDSLNTFTRYYDFKFAKLNCVAFGTACHEIGANAYPHMLLFKNGEKIKSLSGDRPMEEISKFIEESLEMIKPGSRPLEGIELPKSGAKEFVPKKKPATSQLIKPPSASTNDDLVKPPGAVRPTNPDGVSFPFTAETFDQLQRKTVDPWLVKFYAPWCPHCQHMAPAWTAMARDMKGKLNVGEVNCDAESKLCDDLGANSYPTILFFRGSEHVEYEGLRGLGDFVDYANQAVEASTVKTVSAADFAELEKTEEVIFVYFYDHATTSEDFAALERLPLHLIGRGKIVKTSDKDLATRFNVLTFPRLLVSKDGKATIYEQLTPQDMRNVEKIRTWMQSVWLPLVPEVSAFNAQLLMNGKLVVLGILSRERKEEFAVAKREIKNAALAWMDGREKAYELDLKRLRDAKQLRIKEAEDKQDKAAVLSAQEIQVDMDAIKRKEVVFAWIDGVFWERWIRTTFGISINSDGEKVVINDQANRRYWDSTSSGKPIVPSRTSILETLSQVYDDPLKLPSKYTDSRFVRFFVRSRNFVVAHPWIATIGGTAGLLAALSWFIKARRLRKRNFGSGGFFKLEERAGNGSFASGKVD